LFKQVVFMLDSIVEQLKAGCVFPTQLQLRAAFEAHIYLDWILKRKTEWRPRAYMVAEMRQELRWAKRSKKGTPEYESFRKDYAGVFRVTGGPIPDEDQDMVQGEIDRLESRLNDPARRGLNRRFERLKKKIGHDPNWYAVLFPRKGKSSRPSLRTLAKDVDRLDEYGLVYEYGSRVTHAAVSRAHIRRGPDGKTLLIPLREPIGFTLAAHQMVSIVLALYADVLQEYRPGEAMWFVERYKERWRPILQALPAIEPQAEINDLG
jgi:hypothetical protein